MIIRVRDEFGNFIKVPLGSVSSDDLAAAIVSYFSEHPITETDPTVPDWAKQPNKPIYTAGEVGAYAKGEIGTIKDLLVGNDLVSAINYIYQNKVDGTHFANAMSGKADKSTTLAGYGIEDAYTKDETDEYLQALDEKLQQKMEETVLYEDVVNTPEWINQPTYEGTLDSAFNTSDYYYVTLKDANGNALSSGQFMLKSSFETSATIYSTVFFLANLNAGTETLTENHPVEFISVGVNLVMRDAGATSISHALSDKWNLTDDFGKIRVVIHGQLIQKSTNGYFYCMFSTDKNVPFHHSADGTNSFESDSTKQLITYAPVGGVVYQKKHYLYDCNTVERDGNGYFTLNRHVAVNYESTRKKIFRLSGYGVTKDGAEVVGISYKANSSANGIIRNGTYIRISEVR